MKEVPIIEECIEALQRAPLIFGIRMFESFAMAQNGRIPLPDEDENEINRHTVLVLGYSREDRCFYFRDTYLRPWGSFDGSLPFEYIEKGYVLEIGQGLITINSQISDKKAQLN